MKWHVVVPPEKGGLFKPRGSPEDPLGAGHNSEDRSGTGQSLLRRKREANGD